MMDLQVPKKWMILGASHESFIIHDLDKFFFGGGAYLYIYIYIHIYMISPMDLHKPKKKRKAMAEKNGPPKTSLRKNPGPGLVGGFNMFQPL